MSREFCIILICVNAPWIVILVPLIRSKKHYKLPKGAKTVSSYRWLKARKREERERIMSTNKLDKQVNKFSEEVKNIIDKNPVITIGEAVNLVKEQFELERRKKVCI